MSLKHALLGLLSYKPMTGYELKQFFDSTVHHFWNAELSQIYPTLKTLEEQGWVEKHVTPGEGRPDRKIYELTEGGRGEFVRWVREPAPPADLRDAFMIKVFFGATMLVDGGGLPSYGGSIRSRFDIGESVVSPYLWSRSIRRIDVIAVTHADNDHTGGVPALLENFDVGELWLAAGPDDERMLPLLESARARGVPVRRLQQGDCETLGAVAIEVLSPLFAQEVSGRKNDDSLVLRASYGNQSFLLTGDIERRAEQALLAGPQLGPQTVLKLAHHGSRTSTSPQFLERVQPSFAIVSSGYRNSYGHPHPDVIRRLVSEHNYQFKFVVSSIADCAEVLEYVGQYPEIDRDRVMLMPEGTSVERLRVFDSWLPEYCRRHHLRFCPRRQIDWFGHSRGT